ncbi:hypothetical protein ACLB2K_015564 [Fragaria x ananassa]
MVLLWTVFLSMLIMSVSSANQVATTQGGIVLLLPRSISRRLWRKSFVTKVEEEKDVGRWRSFRELLQDRDEPSDQTTASTKSTDGKTNNESWGESEFSLNSESSVGNYVAECKSGSPENKKVGGRAGVTAGEDSIETPTTTTTTATSTCSPHVQILLLLLPPLLLPSLPPPRLTWLHLTIVRGPPPPLHPLLLSPATTQGGIVLLLPRSISRRLWRKSFVTKVEEEKDVGRWRSFRELLQDRDEPSDQTTASTKSTDGKTNSESWGESEFSLNSESSVGNYVAECKSGSPENKKVGGRAGITAGEDSIETPTTTTTTATSTCSPHVQILLLLLPPLLLPSLPPPRLTWLHLTIVRGILDILCRCCRFLAT